MTHSHDQAPTHGHFTDRECRSCRTKDQRIAELEAKSAKLERLIASRDKRIVQLIAWRNEHKALAAAQEPTEKEVARRRVKGDVAMAKAAAQEQDDE